MLSKVKPKATTTNLEIPCFSQKTYWRKPGRIVVFSDFISTEGPDVSVVKAMLSSEEKLVDFIDVPTMQKYRHNQT